MTFDFSVALTEIIKKELKISHFAIKVFVGKLSRMQNKYKNLIQKQFGKTFLADANYVVFFTGMLSDKKQLKKLTDILNRSFGGKISVSISELKKLDTAIAEDDDDDDVEDILDGKPEGMPDDVDQEDLPSDEEPTSDEAPVPMPEEPVQQTTDTYFLKITLK